MASNQNAVSAAPAALELSDERKLLNLYKNEIPERVRGNVPLRVDTSYIPGAGRGLFVMEDVVAGDVLFTIDNPLLLVVDSGIGAAFICDNCFATVVPIPQQSLQTVAGDPIVFSSCDHCKSLFYCSKKYQTEAWAHHHELECKTIKEISASVAVEKEIGCLHTGKQFRALLRLIILRTHGKISDSEWAEIKALQTGKHWKAKNSEWSTPTQKVVKCILDHVEGINMDSKDVTELYWAIYDNNHDISQPLIKIGSGVFDTAIPSGVCGGLCLEPFAAMINHRCKRNAAWDCEGRQLIFKATRRIAANDEILINYARERGDDNVRKQQLLTSWNITCGCIICQNGVTSPVGALRTLVLALAHSKPSDTLFSMRAVENAIAAMRAAGLGYDAYPMWELHRHLFRGYYQNGRFEDALKIGFTLYAVIAPAQPFIVYQEYATDMLGNILQLIDPVNLTTTIGSVNTTWGMFHHFFPILLDKYVMETKKLYGANSKISQYAEEFLGTKLELYRVVRESQGEHGCYARMDQNQEQRQCFVDAMNKVLNWAQLPPSTMGSLFRF
ncbi:hypothetical protein N431DRAFT_559368 [Stipitochalara longipes BDJ]|nr:hypothetical protein N431DRAFT_559368 [Stipitochalara longipes BDJ]